MPTPVVSLLLRFGGLLHRYGRWSAAERVYARTAALAPGEAEPAYRLGIVRQRTGDFEGARGAYTAALAAGALDPLSCLQRRAAVNRELGDAEALADDLGRLARALPEDRKWWRELAETLESLGRVPGVVAALDGAAAAGGEGLEDLTRRADLKAEIADWAGALELYRLALERRPRSSRVRLKAATVAEWLYRTPFRVVDESVVPADGAERREALEEAIALLRACDDQAGISVPYRLGRLYETAGRLIEASECYQRAVDLAEEADKVWSELKMAVWGFRRDYAGAAAGGDTAAERLALSVHDAEPVADLEGVGGLCDFGISRYGLSIKGFVLHGAGEAITVHVDGEPLFSVAVDGDTWRPGFRASVKHLVLATLGTSTEIAVTAGGRPLVTASGAAAIRLDNPHGTGRFADRRAEGFTVNKKGYWSPPAHVAERRQARLVAAYQPLADFMEGRLDRRPFLLYGTLLGCHRDGRLIPGDDDFDVGYLAPGDTPEEAKADSVAVMRACLEAGFDVGVGGEGRPFNVRAGGCEFDVHPVWFHRDRAYAFNAHNLAPVHFDPPIRAELSGRKVYVPADTEAFLADNYGHDWREPRSDFKYYRSKETVATMRRAQLRLSELRELGDFARRTKAESPGAGDFYGFVDEPLAFARDDDLGPRT